MREGEGPAVQTPLQEVKTMTKIQETITRDELFHNSYDDHYIKTPCVKIHMYRNCGHITDLTNALKVGKTCIQYVIFTETSESRDDFKSSFFNWLTDHSITLETFLEKLLAGEQFDGLQINTREQKGVNTFSPFAEIKPIKTPAKWTIPHIWKAILAGQIVKGACDGYYTDDYARDAADNYRQGPIDVKALAQKLIESPSGWWCSVDGSNKGIIQLSVNCHHFDTNTLWYYADPKKAKAAAEAEAKAKAQTIKDTEQTQAPAVDPEPASKSQLFTLYCITGAYTRDWKLSAEQARELIRQYNSGATRQTIYAACQTNLKAAQ